MTGKSLTRKFQDEPSWWYSAQPSFAATALVPAGLIYGAISGRRMIRSPTFKAHVPVICIGNLTAGGTGKTPLTIWLVSRLKARGEHPVILTRGYGGRLSGPLLADPEIHSATDTGDEPLLLAKAAPTVISRDRSAGAKAIADLVPAATVIVMDDGLQNPSLAKDLRIAIVDARRGIGNGKCIPAGPLRAPLGVQLKAIDALILNQPPGAATEALSEPAWTRAFTGPIMSSTTKPVGETDWLKGKRVTAFAGIANPERFFGLLQTLGADVVSRLSFPDHHAFTEGDARTIIAAAKTSGTIPITTEKDHVRLSRSVPMLAELARNTRTVAIAPALNADNTARLDDLLSGVLNQKRNMA